MEVPTQEAEKDELFQVLCNEMAEEKFWDGSKQTQSSSKKQLNQLRKRKRQPIPENDPRKYYIDNIMNAFNSGDINQIRTVFMNQNTSDCLFIQRYSAEIPDVPAHREFHGVELMIQYLEQLLEAIPDGLLVVTGRQLNIRVDGSSYLVARVNMSGLWLLQVLFSKVYTRTRNLLASWNPLASMYNYFLSYSQTQSTTTITNTILKEGDHQQEEDNKDTDKQDNKNKNIPIKLFASTDFSSSSMNLSDENNCEEEIMNTATATTTTTINRNSKEINSSFSSSSSLDVTSKSSSKSHGNNNAKTMITTPSPNTPNPNNTTKSGWKPVEVLSQDSQFTLVARQTPYRFNISISYVAHINQDMKIYKSETFIRGNQFIGQTKDDLVVMQYADDDDVDDDSNTHNNDNNDHHDHTNIDDNNNIDHTKDLIDGLENDDTLQQQDFVINTATIPPSSSFATK
jgi:hypothetical protein